MHGPVHAGGCCIEQCHLPPPQCPLMQKVTYPIVTTSQPDHTTNYIHMFVSVHGWVNFVEVQQANIFNSTMGATYHKDYIHAIR